MKTPRALLIWTLLLTMLLTLAPAAGAQGPTPTPPTWTPPMIYKYADVTCCDPNGQVEFTITVTNPGNATWYNVRVTDQIDPHLRIDAVTTTLGTATITGNTVVVNGTITLPPGNSFVITIVCTVLSFPPSEEIYNTASVEYTDPDGHPWGPIRVSVPVKIVPCTPPVIPEASTLILVGGAATGLAGYIGLQIRARRRKGS